MSSLSRRDFFTHFAHHISDQVDGAALKKIASKLTSSKPAEGLPQWAMVSSIIEMAPGTSCERQVSGQTIMLTSLPEGVFAQKTDGCFVALRSGANGAIEVNVDMEWPRLRVLSHSTGEPLDLNDENTAGEQQ